MLLVDLLEIGGIFATPHADGDFVTYVKCLLLPDALDDEGLHRALQLLIVVVVVIFPILRKAERTEGGDVELIVKWLQAAKSMDVFVHKNRGKLRFFLEIISNAAFLLQPDGIGEGNARHARAKAPGIDAEDKNALPPVIVKFLVECRHRLDGLLRFVRKKHGNMLRHVEIIGQGKIETEDLLGKGHVKWEVGNQKSEAFPLPTSGFRI